MKKEKKLKNIKNKGSVLLGTTIIILAAALIIATSVQFLGIGDDILSLGQQQSEQSISLADSCIKESALRIQRNNTWSGGNLIFSPGSCNITVTSSGNSRTVSATATIGQSVRKITAVITISGASVSITSWAEDIL